LRLTIINFIKKIKFFERQFNILSNIFDYIRKSLITKNPKQYYLIRTKTLNKRPKWVKKIVQYFNKISVKLKNIKKIFDIYLFINNNNLPNDTSATNIKTIPEAELQYKTPL
jgi:hypothetical protein